MLCKLHHLYALVFLVSLIGLVAHNLHLVNDTGNEGLLDCFGDPYVIREADEVLKFGVDCQPAQESFQLLIQLADRSSDLSKGPFLNWNGLALENGNDK